MRSPARIARFSGHLRLLNATRLVSMVLLVALTASAVSLRAESGTEARADGLPPWLAEFQDPPTTYRPQMFWVWNGRGERLHAISSLPSPSKRTWSDTHNGGNWSHAMPGGHEGIRRQLDLNGNGRADFIMPFGAWHWGSDSILFLMEGR